MNPEAAQYGLFSSLCFFAFGEINYVAMGIRKIS